MLLTRFFRRFSKEKKKVDEVNDGLYHALIQRMNHIIYEEELFLDKNLRISMVSKKMNTTDKKISQALNDHLKMNFNSYINKFRVAYAERLLQLPKYNHYKIESIGMESGFNNKVSFFKYFKKYTGLTPLEYRIVLMKKLTK